MNTQAIRVLIADDHQVVGEGLSLVLERGGIEVVAAALTGRQAVDMAIGLSPDVVLLDVLMPDMDGLAALAVIKYMRPEIPVLMLTFHTRQEHIDRARALGADGFLSKDIGPEELAKSIRTAVGLEDQDSEESWYDLVAPSVHTGSNGSDGEDDELTDQEGRILGMMAKGLRNEMIADQLSISRNTLKTHLRHIYSKIGVSDRTQAAIWALRKGLIT